MFAVDKFLVAKMYDFGLINVLPSSKLVKNTIIRMNN